MGESSRTTNSSRGADTAPDGEEAIDDALAESFPASDAPPWTLGLDPHSVYLPTTHTPVESATERQSSPMKPRSFRRTR